MLQSLKNARLRCVAVLSRHGERNPYPQSATVTNLNENVPLTDTGRKQMQRLGQRLRSFYGSKSFPPLETPIRLIARSSPKSRCVDSVRATVRGLSPQTPVHVTPDPMLAFKLPKVSAQFLHWQRKYADVVSYALVGIDNADELTEERKVIQTMIHIDNLKNRLLIGKPLPNTLSESMRRRQIQYYATFAQMNMMDSTEHRNTALPILKLIVNTLSESASSGHSLFFLLGTHDVVLDNVLSYLKKLPGRPCEQPFGASITFELYDSGVDAKGSKPELLMRMLYSGDRDRVPGDPLISWPLSHWQNIDDEECKIRDLSQRLHSNRSHL